MPTIYIETHGCQMNEADSQYIADRAARAGYTIASAPQDANVLVLNTCTVRDNAERRAYGRIGHFKELKDADPALRVVVTGCLAEQDKDRMRRLAPHVDGLFGTKELAELGDALASWGPQFEATAFSEERALLLPMGGHADGIADAFSHLRAFVTVQRGCSYYCTFCIVPHVRGRFDHRPTAEIVAEVAQQLAAGAREIMLVGQTVNAWSDPVTGADFGDLCGLIAVLPGLERLTFVSPHPRDFTEKMVRDFASIPQLNPRVHLPLQSGSDAILRRMNRKYTRAQFEQKVALFHRCLPAWAITTDIIVGFPGETDADFEDTMDLVERDLFSNAYTFVYSIRRGTPAARWEQVPAEVSSARYRRLIEAQNASNRRYHDAAIGTTVRALIAGPSRKDPSRLAAKSPHNVTVIAPKPPDYDEELYAREPWLDVRVERAFVWGTMGTIVGRAPRFTQEAVAVAPPIVDLLAERAV